MKIGTPHQRRFPCHERHFVILDGPGSFRRHCPLCSKWWVIDVVLLVHASRIAGRPKYRPVWTPLAATLPAQLTIDEALAS